MARKFTFDELTKTLTTDDDLKLIRDRAIFHCFNPNGAVADKDAADREIDDAIDQGIVRGGAYLAYGGGANYHVDALMKLAQSRKPRGWDVNYHIRGCHEAAAKARLHIMEKKAAQSAA